MTRLVLDTMSRSLGHPFVAENRPGDPADFSAAHRCGGVGGRSLRSLPMRWRCRLVLKALQTRVVGTGGEKNHPYLAVPRSDGCDAASNHLRWDSRIDSVSIPSGL